MQELTRFGQRFQIFFWGCFRGAQIPRGWGSTKANKSRPKCFMLRAGQSGENISGSCTARQQAHRPLAAKEFALNAESLQREPKGDTGRQEREHGCIEGTTPSKRKTTSWGSTASELSSEASSSSPSQEGFCSAHQTQPQGRRGSCRPHLPRSRPELTVLPAIRGGGTC